MPQISPPERGQPLDIDYLYEIAESINDINNQVSSTSNAESRIAGADSSRTDAVKTSSIKFYAAQIPVAAGKVSSGGITTAPIRFPSNFAYPPIVTITPIIQNYKDESKNCIATIENVTTAGADIILTFTKDANQVDVDVHVIAIGQA